MRQVDSQAPGYNRLVMVSRLNRSEILIRSPAEILDCIRGAVYDRQHGGWRCHIGFRVLRDLLTKASITFDQSATDIGDAFMRMMDGLKNGPPNFLQPIPSEHTKAWGHQRVAFWLCSHILCEAPCTEKQFGPIGGFILALDMGAGKSKVLLDLCFNLNCRDIIILCPKAVGAVWPDQIERHRPDLLDRSQLLNLTEENGTAKRMKAIHALDPAKPVVVVLNYEALLSELIVGWLMGRRWDVMALDEGHRLKSPRGRQSVVAAKLSRHVPCRIALTGTPMPHSPADIWGLMRTVDGAVLDPYFTGFRSRYCIMGGFQNRQIVAFRHLEELSHRISRVSYTVRTEDVLDIPQEHHVVRLVALDEKTRRVYTEMDKHLVAWLEAASPPMIAANAMTKVTALQEITSGFCRDADGDFQEIGTEKEDALQAIFEDLPELRPVVVFAKFVHDLQAVHRAAEKAGRKSSELSGRRKELEAWKAGETSVLAVQITAGKEGIDLTRAATTVYYSHPFSYGDFEQSMRRTRRPGQSAARCTYYHLIADRTVDRQIYRALQRKGDVIHAVLADIRTSRGGADTLLPRPGRSGDASEGGEREDQGAGEPQRANHQAPC